jgi:hypothetical protein
MTPQLPLKIDPICTCMTLDLVEHYLCIGDIGSNHVDHATQQSRNLATQQSRNPATQQSRNLATQQ